MNEHINQTEESQNSSLYNAIQKSETFSKKLITAGNESNKSSLWQESTKWLDKELNQADSKSSKYSLHSSTIQYPQSVSSATLQESATKEKSEK